MSRAEIIELVDSLSPDEQDTLKEYALYLRTVDEKPPYWTDDLEAEYRHNLLDGITKGLEDMKKGRVYTSEQAKSRLSELLCK